MPILKGGAKAPQQPAKSSNPPKAPAGPKRDAFAQKLAETDAQSGGQWTPPPPGTYNALITEAQGEVDGDKTDAYFELTIVDHDELAGKTCRIYFNFTGEDGEEKSGMPYFKQALEMLGVNVEESVTSWESMCEVIAEIAAEQTWVIIDVKKKGKWTNVFLSSVPEEQSQKPEMPE